MSTEVNSSQPWTACLDRMPVGGDGQNVILIGVLRGEGVGPEVMASTLEVLHAVGAATGLRFDIRYGGAIGREAERIDGRPLSPAVVEFCEDVFRGGGAILCGPGGGRFVYDLRRQFDLFFKISPIQASNGITHAGRLRPDAVRNVDILIAREGKAGVYQGAWDEQRDAAGEHSATQSVSYTEPEVRRFLDASARLAKLRRGELTVVWKESGVPTISALWKHSAEAAASKHGVSHRLVDIDLMAYRLIQEAATFDVIAAPNLFGDVLADLGAVLLGSRGVSYSGNYSSCGHSVYQTNHGAAYDLVGTDQVNPVGQILSLSMMLRETFFLPFAATAIEEAIRSVWEAGYVTADLDASGHQVIGTSEMGARIAKRVEGLLRSRSSVGKDHAAPPGLG